MIVSACELPNEFRLLYPDDMSIKDKIETIATEIYRADGVDYAPIASRKIRQYEDSGAALAADLHGEDASQLERQSQTERRARWLPHHHHRCSRSAGAGFIYPLCGDVRTMPGLGRRPAAMNVDIDEDGVVVGLF